MIMDVKSKFHASILATILVLSISSSMQINSAFASHTPDPFQGFSKVNVQFDTRPKVSPLIIDGILYLAEDLPVSFEWIAGSRHTVEVPEVEVFDQNSVKYIFNGWNDLGKQPKRDMKFNEDFSYVAYFIKEPSQSRSLGKEWTVTLDTLPRQSPLIIDGMIYLSSQLPVKFNWIGGSNHTFSVPDKIVPAGEQTRYVFSGWNDMNNEMTRTIKVENDSSFTAIFDTQYLLKIDSPFGKPKGQGWYDSYDTASISIDPIVQLVPGKKRAIFAGWSDGDNRYSIENTVTMSQPKTINAVWKIQYFVSVTSHMVGPNVKGTGWHDEKSQVLISADAEYEPLANNHKFTFAGWKNIGENKAILEDAKAASTTLTVTDSVALEANWNEWWYLKVNSPYGDPFGEGYYKAGEIAKVAITSPYNVTPEESRLVFTGWSGASNLKDAQLELVMDEYKEITANWKEQYYLKTISRYPGVEGSGWYDKGSVAKFEVHNPQNGGLGRQILFQQWLGDFQSSSKEGSILMDQPRTVIANYHEDFAFLYYIVAAIVAIIALPTAFVMFKPKILELVESRINHTKKSRRSRRRKHRGLKISWK